MFNLVEIVKGEKNQLKIAYLVTEESFFSVSKKGEKSEIFSFNLLVSLEAQVRWAEPMKLR